MLAGAFAAFLFLHWLECQNKNTAVKFRQDAFGKGMVLCSKRRRTKKSVCENFVALVAVQ